MSASTSGRAGRVDLVQGGQPGGPRRRCARSRSRGGSRTSAASVRRGALLRETTRLIEFQLGALRAHRGRRFLRPFLSALSRRPDGGAGGALYLHLERVRLTGDVVLRTTVTVTTVVTTYTSAPVVTPLVTRSRAPRLERAELIMVGARSGARRSLCAARAKSTAASSIFDPVNVPSTSMPTPQPGRHPRTHVPESTSDLTDAPQVLTRLGVGRRGRRGRDASICGTVHELNASRLHAALCVARWYASRPLIAPHHAPALLPASRHLPFARRARRS